MAADEGTRWTSGAERDRVLERRGWHRRYVGGPPRLDEQIALYRSLGHEVRVESLSPEEIREECGDCALALSFFKVVYTRKSP